MQVGDAFVSLALDSLANVPVVAVENLGAFLVWHVSLRGERPCHLLHKDHELMLVHCVELATLNHLTQVLNVDHHVVRVVAAPRETILPSRLLWRSLLPVTLAILALRRRGGGGEESLSVDSILTAGSEKASLILVA